MYFLYKKLNKDCLKTIKDFLYYSKLDMEWFKFLHKGNYNKVLDDIKFLGFEYNNRCFYSYDNKNIQKYREIMNINYYFNTIYNCNSVNKLHHELNDTDDEDIFDIDEEYLRRGIRIIYVDGVMIW